MRLEKGIAVDTTESGRDINYNDGTGPLDVVPAEWDLGWRLLAWRESRDLGRGEIHVYKRFVSLDVRCRIAAQCIERAADVDKKAGRKVLAWTVP